MHPNCANSNRITALQINLVIKNTACAKLPASSASGTVLLLKGSFSESKLFSNSSLIGRSEVHANTAVRARSMYTRPMLNRYACEFKIHVCIYKTITLFHTYIHTVVLLKINDLINWVPPAEKQESADITNL